MRRLSLLSSAALAALASCSAPEIVPQPAPAPIPVPVATPTPTPRPTPTLGQDWRDWPLTPGTWAYRQDGRGSIALFGAAGQDAELTLRCDRGRGRLYLSRRGETDAITVRTSTTLRRLTALPTGSTPAYAAAELAVDDAIIDAAGFSRGRFVVESAGLAALVVPAWPELLRVAEDCRG